MANNEKPYLTVYTFDTDHQAYSYSQFCTKLHFRLRHAGIPYEDGKGSRQQAPKSKMPYVKFNETGKLMGDSGLITQRLVELGKVADLNADLSPEMKAQDLALRSLVEERLYYLFMRERWRENYKSSRDEGPFSTMPWGVRHFAGIFLRLFITSQLYFQGTGRHSREEVKRLREEGIEALANLAAGPYHNATQTSADPFWILGGTEPTEADFTLFGYLSGSLIAAPNPHTTALVWKYPALTSYVERIHTKYFADFKSPFGQGDSGASI